MTGLLLRLHQKKGHRNQGLAQELQLRQQIHIPSQAKELQKSIALTVHREAAHPGYLKTYQLLQRTFSWFKVLWEDNTVTWEPLSNLDHAAEVISSLTSW